MCFKEEPMAVYYIGTYDIQDPEQFKQYPPVVMALLPRYGGTVLASDTAAYAVEGKGANNDCHHQVSLPGGGAGPLQ
jgi:uncharacterized protein (DUF1330 family)